MDFHISVRIGGRHRDWSDKHGHPMASLQSCTHRTYPRGVTDSILSAKENTSESGLSK